MKHGVLALVLACRKAPTLPLMLQKAAEMKKYDNSSTRAEAGRCSGPTFVGNKVMKVSNRPVALGNM